MIALMGSIVTYYFYPFGYLYSIIWYHFYFRFGNYTCKGKNVPFHVNFLDFIDTISKKLVPSPPLNTFISAEGKGATLYINASLLPWWWTYCLVVGELGGVYSRVKKI
jgi:hypothetical protein